MNKQFIQYDYLRYEFFEKLLPQIIYEDNVEEKENILDLLQQDGSEFIHLLLRELCEEDHLSYPYGEDDIKVNTPDRNGIRLIQVTLPPPNPEIDDIVRAYVSYSAFDNGKTMRNYHLIRQFTDGRTLTIYISPQGEAYQMSDLTDHPNDMEYEYGMLEDDCLRILVHRMEEDKAAAGHVKETLQKIGSFIPESCQTDIPGLDDVYHELGKYLEQLSHDHPSEYNKIILYLRLTENGMPCDEAVFWSNHAETLRQILKLL